MEGQHNRAVLLLNKCPPANGWTVRYSLAHRGVLLGHEKGRSMNPGYNVKYILPSEKCQTHRDKIFDSKILVDPPVGDSRSRLESVTPPIDPKLYQSHGRGQVPSADKQKVQHQPRFPLGTCLPHSKASPQLWLVSLETLMENSITLENANCLS